MKKTIITIGSMIALTLAGCSNQEIESHSAGFEKNAIAKPELTINGLNWREQLAKEKITVDEAYLGQVCTYIENVASDGYASSTDFEVLALSVAKDNAYTLTTDQIASVVVAALMKDCPEYISVVRGY